MVVTHSNVRMFAKMNFKNRGGVNLYADDFRKGNKYRNIGPGS